MIHSRDDYQRIQDPSNKIPEDEPVFLMRAQDRFAALAILYYADVVAAEAERTHDHRLRRHAEQARAHAHRMEAWPTRKTPDLQLHD